MRKILAVSGGIDSMVMLDMLKDDNPVVAHFDHGIRSDSHEDYLFVERKAAEYGLEFAGKVAKLGDGCSEEKARKARYQFLFDVCKEKDGTLHTAHHADDVIESIVINLCRGTGWRGLAPLSRNDVERPLIEMYKKDIYKYAAEHNITFREDSTNNSEDYLRNRIRFKIREYLSDKDKQEIYQKYLLQSKLSSQIDEILSGVCPKSNSLSRTLISENDNASLEILRYFLTQNDISLTRPQLNRVCDAIRSFAPGKKCDLVHGASLKIGRYQAYIER